MSELSKRILKAFFEQISGNITKVIPLFQDGQKDILIQACKILENTYNEKFASLI